MLCRDVMARLSPFLDNELDPVASREVSQHLDSCAACSAALDQQRRLSESLKRDLEYHRAPDLLRMRVARELRASAQGGSGYARPTPPWRFLSAAAAVMVVVGGVWMAGTLSRERATDLTVREVVAGHIRSLMANHLTDVASTDQHTVKPWFAGRLDFSPPVSDFAEAGYPLVGGRLDYLQGHPVAALVYLRHKHTINVFVWPATNEQEGFAPAMTRQGFHVIHGASAGMVYWLVSDLNSDELGNFVRMVAARPAKP